ncbi:hypothetical protein M5K25_026935 [Dendrobium thyrsiflorum]|uniref:Uncharacterized protein n=1 Tax=Dendrobium thyrsiflorum TaxID=117978 RepID=A0ABD0TYQ1_DENTH
MNPTDPSPLAAVHEFLEEPKLAPPPHLTPEHSSSSSSLPDASFDLAESNLLPADMQSPFEKVNQLVDSLPYKPHVEGSALANSLYAHIYISFCSVLRGESRYPLWLIVCIISSALPLGIDIGRPLKHSQNALNLLPRRKEKKGKRTKTKELSYIPSIVVADDHQLLPPTTTIITDDRHQKSPTLLKYYQYLTILSNPQEQSFLPNCSWAGHFSCHYNKKKLPLNKEHRDTFLIISNFSCGPNKSSLHRRSGWAYKVELSWMGCRQQNFDLYHEADN